MLLKINEKQKNSGNLHTIKYSEDKIIKRYESSSLGKKKQKLKKRSHQFQEYSFLLSEQISCLSQFTKTYKGINHITNQTIEIKVIQIKKQNKDNLQLINNQHKILRMLNNQHIVRLQDTHLTQNKLYIMTQYCNQGNLAAYLKKQIRLKEEIANQIIIQIIKGYQYLYKNDIIHCNLSLENIYVHNNSIKIGGFSYSIHKSDKQISNFKKQIHSLEYCAPQVLQKGQYTYKSDIFSIGVIYYQLIHGYKPWNQKTVSNLLGVYEKQTLRFGPSCKISQKQKNFIEKCLNMNKDQRINSKQFFQKDAITLKKNSKTSIIIQQIPDQKYQDDLDQYQLKNKILKHIKNRKPNEADYHRYNRFYTKPVITKNNNQYIRKSSQKQYIIHSTRKNKKQNESLVKASGSLGSSQNLKSIRDTIKKIQTQKSRKRFLSNNIQFAKKNDQHQLNKLRIETVKTQNIQQREFNSDKQFINFIQNTIQFMNQQKNQLYFKRLFDKVIYILEKIKSVLSKKVTPKLNQNSLCDPYLKIIEKQYKIEQVWNVGSFYFKRLDRMINHTLLHSLKSNIYNDYNDKIIYLLSNLKNVEKMMQKIVKNRLQTRNKENARHIYTEYNPL